jgi:hypothetical protein
MIKVMIVKVCNFQNIEMTVGEWHEEKGAWEDVKKNAIKDFGPNPAFDGMTAAYELVLFELAKDDNLTKGIVVKAAPCPTPHPAADVSESVDVLEGVHPGRKDIRRVKPVKPIGCVHSTSAKDPTCTPNPSEPPLPRSPKPSDIATVAHYLSPAYGKIPHQVPLTLHLPHHSPRPPDIGFPLAPHISRMPEPPDIGG